MTGVKQSQLLVLRLSLEFDNILKNYKVRANLRVSLVFIFGPKLNSSGLHGGGQKKYCVVGLLGGMLLSNSAHQQACYDLKLIFVEALFSKREDIHNMFIS